MNPLKGFYRVESESLASLTLFEEFVQRLTFHHEQK